MDKGIRLRFIDRFQAGVGVRPLVHDERKPPVSQKPWDDSQVVIDPLQSICSVVWKLGFEFFCSWAQSCRKALMSVTIRSRNVILDLMFLTHSPLRSVPYLALNSL